MSTQPGSKSKLPLSTAKRRVFQCLTVVLSLLVCLASLEIGLKVFGPKYYRFNNSSYEYYTNPRAYFDIRRVEGDRIVYWVPDSEGGFPPRRIPDSLSTREDTEAFLGREDTILALGDSFTVGRGVRYEHTYVRRLEKMLASNRRRVTIKNTASSGYDLDEILTIYDIHSKPGQYPLVIYGFVLNDFGLSGLDGAVGSDYIDLNNGGVQYNTWRKHYATVNMVYHVVETIRLDRVTRKAYIEAFQGKNAAKNFQDLSKLNRRIREDGGRLLIVLFPLLYDFQDYDFKEIHDKLTTFAQKESVPLLDLLPAFSKYKAKELWVHPTDHHPNEIANQVAAEEIHAYLKREGLLDLLPDD